MHVRVDSAGRRNQSFAGEHLGSGADDQARVDTVLHVGVAGLADAGDPSVLDADVGLDDADDRIHHHHTGDDEVQGAVDVADARDLAHPVAHRLAAAEDEFFTGREQAAFHLCDQIGVGKPEPVAGGGSV